MEKDAMVKTWRNAKEKDAMKKLWWNAHERAPPGARADASMDS